MRLAEAQSRNHALEEKIPATTPLGKFRAKHGTQRTATKLIMAGLLVASAPRIKS